MRLNIIRYTRKIIVTICCLLLIGLLAGPMMAFGQNDSTPMPTEAIATTTVGVTPTPLVTPNATGTSPPSLGGLLIIFVAMVLIVLVPIAIFALYNKSTLEDVLNKNGQLEPKEKRESITTLIKALIPPEPLGMPNGSVRAVIAIIGISIFAYAVFNFSETREELVSALIALVSSVIGFYFGGRATEEVRKPPKESKEKTPKPTDQPPKPNDQ